MIALDMLKRHEGYRQKPYHCTEGRLTVGYGRNLDDRGISQSEAEYLLKNDINEAVKELQKLPCWLRLNEARQAVLINMSVNMGVAGLMQFRKMLDAVNREDWQGAVFEMRNSKWAKQLPTRSAELQGIMLSGVAN